MEFENTDRVGQSQTHKVQQPLKIVGSQMLMS